MTVNSTGIFVISNIGPELTQLNFRVSENDRRLSSFSLWW